MSKKQITRNITILARYQIKKDGVFNGTFYHAGEIVLHVRNDRGVCYYVTLRPYGVHSCTCPARKPCYHITHCKGVENARAASVNAKKREEARLLAEVEAICVEAERELSATPALPDQTPVLAAPATPATPPARELAPLGGNRPFSLMR